MLLLCCCCCFRISSSTRQGSKIHGYSGRGSSCARNTPAPSLHWLSVALLQSSASFASCSELDYGIPTFRCMSDNCDIWRGFTGTTESWGFVVFLHGDLQVGLSSRLSSIMQLVGHRALYMYVSAVVGDICCYPNAVKVATSLLGLFDYTKRGKRWWQIDHQ